MPSNHDERANEQDAQRNPLLDAARQVWWAGLGLIAIAGEQTERAMDKLIARGRSVEPAVSEAFRKAGDELGEAADKAGARIKEAVGHGTAAAGSALDSRVAAALERMGFPTKEELSALSRKLDELAAKLDQLQRRREQPQADSI